MASFEEFFGSVRRRVANMDRHDWPSDEVARLMRKHMPYLVSMWNKGWDAVQAAESVLLQMQIEEMGSDE